jgi:hypothetical protein
MDAERELFRNDARNPASTAASTWSFIREINGLITIQVPSMT